MTTLLPARLRAFALAAGRVCTAERGTIATAALDASADRALYRAKNVGRNRTEIDAA